MPKIVDIAYFDERLGNVWQFSGKQEGIKTLDGSNFVTMFTSILENNSLTDSQVGIIKKPYEQTFSNRYGVVTHNKCASFPITAELLRYSINSDFNLYHLLEKMKLLSKPVFENFISNKVQNAVWIAIFMQLFLVALDKIIFRD